MYINANLIHAYRIISYRCNDPNRVFDAMMSATKNTIKTYKSRSRYWLLNNMKKERIGTNEVEYGIQWMGQVITKNMVEAVKMKIMRGKVDDAFKELHNKEIKTRELWRTLKKQLNKHYKGATHLVKLTAKEQIVKCARGIAMRTAKQLDVYTNWNVWRIIASTGEQQQGRFIIGQEKK